LIKVSVKPTRTPSIGILGSLGYYDESDLRRLGGVYRNKRYEPETIESPWRFKSHYAVPAPLITRLFEEDAGKQPTFMRGWQNRVETWDEDHNISLNNGLIVSQDAAEFYLKWQDFESDLKRIKEGDMDLIDEILHRHEIENGDFFARVPKPHQKAGLAFFLRSMEMDAGHIALFDEMRTGKTKQAIDIARYLLKMQLINRVLVICPNTIKRVWAEEILLDAPGYGCFSTIIQGTRAKKTSLWESLFFFYITNYEEARAGKESMYEWESEYHRNGSESGYLLVCDEAHKLKNPDSQQSKAVLGLNPKYSIMLTGTPVANRPEDAWSLSNFICPGILGKSIWDFQEEFAVRGGYMGKNIVSYHDLDEVKYRLARISMRRKRKDIIFDQTNYQKRYGELKGDQKKAYDDMRDMLWAEIASAGEYTAVQAQNGLVKVLRLQQITSGYLPKIEPQDPMEVKPKTNGGTQGKDDVIWFKENWKLKELDEFIDEYLDDIGKLVIWSRYVPPIELLTDRYQKYGALMIKGGMKKDDGIDNMYRFQRDEDCKIMVCNILSAEGKGFQPATFSFFWDKWWSPHLNKQAEDRTLGLKNPVPTTVISAITEDSIDDRLEYILLNKLDWAATILGDDKARIEVPPTLSKNTLLYLIAKPEEAEKYRVEMRGEWE